MRASRPAAASGPVIPNQVPWHGEILAWFAQAVLKSISATIRYQLQDEAGAGLHLSSERLIFCIWHNRLALSVAIYHRFIRRSQPRRQLAAMVSASKDGALLARILEHFSALPVRGSTSRRGPQALLELTTSAEKGFDLAITPDGPRGPRYQVQDGIVSLAQLTSLPILPVSYDLSRKFCLKSWDAFQIPAPFARCRVRVGQPVRVPKAGDEEARQTAREQLQLAMKNITAELC